MRADKHKVHEVALLIIAVNSFLSREFSLHRRYSSLFNFLWRLLVIREQSLNFNIICNFISESCFRIFDRASWEVPFTKQARCVRICFFLPHAGCSLWASLWTGRANQVAQPYTLKSGCIKGMYYWRKDIHHKQQNRSSGCSTTDNEITVIKSAPLASLKAS